MSRAGAALGGCAAVLAMSISACFGEPDFRCRADADCVWNDRHGTCEATQYCSYPDPDCASRRRYSDQAGGFADVCVDVSQETGDDSGTTAVSASESGGSESTAVATVGDDSTTGSPQPVCGDGVAEAGERCDDGNAVDGDGCNVDCIPSGVPRWDPAEIVVSGAAGLDAFLVDVDVRPDDTIVAVGREDVDGLAALLVLLGGDGEVVWARQYTPEAGGAAATAVTAAVGSEIFVAGRSYGPMAQGWIGVVEPATGDVEAVEWTTRPIAIGLAYMHPSVLVVGGYGDGTIGAREFTEMLVPLGVAEAVQGGSVAAVAADGVTDVAWVAEIVAGHARVARVQPGDAEPLFTLFEGADGSGAQGLAFGDGGLVLAGYVGLGARDGWLQRIEVDGARGWSWTTRDPAEDEIEDVTVAPTGHVVAAGFTTAFAQDARVWKLAPDGTLMWVWSPESPIPNDDVARAVAVREDGDIVAVGERTGDDGASDGWVVRLTP